MQQCSACGAKVADGLRKCPICGARMDRIALAQPGAGAETEPPRGTRIPRTIEQLQDFCAAHHLPMEKMRFAIGRDSAEARMFGIFRTAEGEFQVYKNKADGSRAVRYQGPDEARAVREIYEKLKSEIALRRDMEQGQGSAALRPGSNALRTGSGAAVQRFQPRSRGEAAKQSSPWKRLLTVAVLVLAGFLLYRSLRSDGPQRGYYNYRDSAYYYDTEDWYYWDPLEALWLPAVLDAAFYDDYDSYYSSDRYPGDAPYGDFADSEWYVPYSSYDDDSDDGWDWDWDDDDWDWDDDADWDSWDTDWDSDW